ncbi:MAG: ATP-binding protein [Chloroflexi bacterium]|nr:ATP-binding protein [Chloroflexota bacterium]
MPTAPIPPLRDQKTFSAGPTVRCLTVLEEAQTMLGDRALDDRNVFVRWVKEGRKYGLGCILVTQQPSSISGQIISQGDNFFVLHLLNEGDLQTLKKHNAYFSTDYLQNAVAQKIAEAPAFKLMPDGPRWLQTRLPIEIEAVLKRHKARSGYAVLEGVTRTVWVLPQVEIKLDKDKMLRPSPVEVRDRI